MTSMADETYRSDLRQAGPVTSENWVAVARSADVGARPLPLALDGVPLILLRTSAGDLVSWLDQCPHRLIPLSAGTVERGTLRCAYHGWEFYSSGRCVALPSQPPEA